MESFSVAVNAVLPFVLYIFFGYLMNRIGIADDNFLNKLNTVAFKAFFPVLMFSNLYHIEEGITFDVKLIALSVVTLLVLVAVLVLTVPRIVSEDAKRSVIIQAIFRSNTVLFAVPLAVNIFGEEAAATASMVVAIIVPLYNVLAVVILEKFRGGQPSMKTLLINILKNPLINGAIVGLLFFLLKIHLPTAIDSPVKAVAGMTTPLALFALGGTLHLRSIRAHLKYLVPTLAVKLILLPLVVTLIATAFGLTGIARFVFFLQYASPVAASSYPMAANMGGDGTLAGEFVVTSTVASLVTLFFWIMLYSQMGLF